MISTVLQNVYIAYTQQMAAKILPPEKERRPFYFLSSPVNIIGYFPSQDFNVLLLEILKVLTVCMLRIFELLHKKTCRLGL